MIFIKYFIAAAYIGNSRRLQSFAGLFFPCKSVLEIYIIEIKRVRKITSFSDNELTTVLLSSSASLCLLLGILTVIKLVSPKKRMVKFYLFF